MARYRTVLDTIGRTPLVRLGGLSSELEMEVFAKVESFNPGGSVKDRVALSMVEAAEKSGQLAPGGTIIEATAGNTGAGLAMVAAVKGYKCIFVLPDKMSQDKVNLLRAYGAEVVITPTSVAPDSPESYNGVAGRLAREIPGAWRPAQFDNPDNPQAHYLSTGPEIWEDSAGAVEVFVAGMGTCGTISGTARYLKEQNPAITVVGADPEGSILSGDAPKSYKVEGIGEDFIPKNLERRLVDEMVRVPDRDSFNEARRLAREEGILVGGSAGTALAATRAYARRLSGPKVIVVLLPDTGRNYLTKIFSDAWMQENGFWEEAPRRIVTISNVLYHKRVVPPLISVAPGDGLDKAVGYMREYGISQLPVIDDGGAVLGSLDEAALMKLLHDGVDFRLQAVKAVMGLPLPVLDARIDVAEAYRVLLGGAGGVIVARDGQPIGVLTRTDLISYWLGGKQ